MKDIPENKKCEAFTVNKIILYGSHYGTAKRYAEELSKRTGVPALPFAAAKHINEYDFIVYVGSLYAGGVLGLAKTARNIRSADGKRFIVATVGLADPADAKNTDRIRQGIRRQLPGEVFERAKLFHLRGGIDYSQLSALHRAMMSLVFRKAQRLPESQKTAEVRAMIDTYNRKVSFVDFSALEQIAAEMGGNHSQS